MKYLSNKSGNRIGISLFETKDNYYFTSLDSLYAADFSARLESKESMIEIDKLNVDRFVFEKEQKALNGIHEMLMRGDIRKFSYSANNFRIGYATGFKDVNNGSLLVKTVTNLILGQSNPDVLMLTGLRFSKITSGKFLQLAKREMYKFSQEFRDRWNEIQIQK